MLRRSDGMTGSADKKPYITNNDSTNQLDNFSQLNSKDAFAWLNEIFSPQDVKNFFAGNESPINKTKFGVSYAALSETEQQTIKSNYASSDSAYFPNSEEHDEDRVNPRAKPPTSVHQSEDSTKTLFSFEQLNHKNAFGFLNTEYFPNQVKDFFAGNPSPICNTHFGRSFAALSKTEQQTINSNYYGSSGSTYLPLSRQAQNYTAFEQEHPDNSRVIAQYVNKETDIDHVCAVTLDCITRCTIQKLPTYAIEKLFQNLTDKDIGFTKKGIGLIDKNIESIVNVYSKMIQIYANAGELLKAETTYNAIPVNNRDIIVHNTMLDTYAKAGKLEETEKFYETIPADQRNDFTYNIMLAAYRDAGKSEETEKFYKTIPVKQRDTITHNILITTRGNAEQWNEAVKLYETIPDARRSMATRLAIITALAVCGKSRQAEGIYREFSKSLKVTDKIPTELRTAMITAYASAIMIHGNTNNAGELVKELRTAQNFYQSIPTDQRDIAIHNAMISVYGNAKNLPKAQAVYNEIPPDQRNIITRTAMITACSNAGEYLEAEIVFNEIPINKLNVAAYSAMITAYGNAGKLRQAELLLIKAVRSGIFKENLGLNGDTLDLHQNAISSQFSADTPHVKGISLVFAKLIFRTLTNQGNRISTVVVGKHGRAILRNGMLEFLLENGYNPKVDPGNPGRLLVLTTLT